MGRAANDDVYQAALRTHPSRRRIAWTVALSSCWEWHRPEPIGAAQDGGEQASRDCDLGKLERDITTVADDLGADLDALHIFSNAGAHGHCLSVRASSRQAGRGR